MSKKKEIKAKLGETETCKEAGVVEELPEVLKVPVAAIEKSFLHRELKIQGVVGEPGQKDNLGYQ
jgi:hypothetical protein